MSRTLGWVLALIGPAFLILILYSAHLVGMGLFSQKANAQLRTIFAEHPLDPSLLTDVNVAAFVEPLKGTKQYASAEQLLVLGSTLERGAYDEFQKQLPRPDLRLQLGTIERWSMLAGRLIAAAPTPNTVSDPEGEARVTRAKLRAELTDELTRRLTPPLSNFERDYYDTVRAFSGVAGYALPELPPEAGFEMSSLTGRSFDFSSSFQAGVLC